MPFYKKGGGQRPQATGLGAPVMGHSVSTVLHALMTRVLGKNEGGLTKCFSSQNHLKSIDHANHGMSFPVCR